MSRWGQEETGGKAAEDEGSGDEETAEQRQRAIQTFIKQSLTEILTTVTGRLFDEIARCAAAALATVHGHVHVLSPDVCSSIHGSWQLASCRC